MRPRTDSHTELLRELLEELKNIHRAIQELGFNNAVTRMPNTMGIGERVVLALEDIAGRLPEPEE